jgi:N-acyl-D-amino-acid deacylase
VVERHAGRENRQNSEVIIRNARMYDGTGSAPHTGDLAVSGDRLGAVGGGLPPAAGSEEVDATGLAVMPGVVDLHTHSDVSLISDPGCVSAIAQGVTTQVVGLCGFSAAPVSDNTLQSMIDEEPIFAFPDVQWTWTTVAGYREAIDRLRPATNVATLVGHNTLRRFVIGGANVSPTSAQLERMRALLREGLREGARGFSTGLSYAPGLFADLDELVALARVAAEEGKPYHTHMRYGLPPIRHILAEAIETAERADVELNVSHLYPRPTDPLDEPERYLEMIEAARGRGVHVTFDLTIFLRGGGAWVQVLPNWARDGGMASTIALLKDPTARARLVHELQTSSGWSWLADWEDQLITKINRPQNAALVGRSIAEIAHERGEAPIQTALNLIEEDGQYWVSPTIKNQAHLDRLMRSPLCVPVTDGMAAHPIKHGALGLMPRTFGTFPQVLGRYVREAGVLTLEDAVHRITQVPAARIGLTDRGVLAPGMAADLVLFDPASIANRATEADPALLPMGIHRVMVNGQWALVDGAFATSRYGRAL